MDHLEVADSIDERPKLCRKYSRDSNKSDRRFQLLLLSFGMLCILQATLNISLRLVLYSSEESTCSNCNTTRFGDQNRVKVLQDCEQGRFDGCNDLQERFNALTRERDLLRNQISELNNVVRNLKLARNEDIKLKDEETPTILNFVYV